MDGSVKKAASKMGNLANEYPELKAFTPDATLSGIKNRYGVQSLLTRFEHSAERNFARRRASRAEG
jgi:hypothetical protein